MISLSLTIHIFSGFSALFSGCAAIFTKKGSWWHIFSGRIFVLSMAMVVITATHLSVLRPNLFLLFISLFSFYLTWSGFIAICRSYRDKAFLFYLNVLITATLFLAGLAMVSIPLLGWIRILIPGELAEHGFLLFIFGIINSSFSGTDLTSLINSSKSNENRRLYRHIGRMGGAYIATCTAFIVVNFTFLPDILLWLGPTFIGSPLIAYSIFRYRQIHQIKSRDK